ncbi:hypothetical protein N1851_002364 [Merluccius polli]|uniref:Reverse transcriptase domain-containing protein n=1 Tax=Merluccius polli TaxID=89951 RepID=A0AA47NBU7_MERPO|nr:hypothetical protein N1851_002364 [Merluccius polli]
MTNYLLENGYIDTNCQKAGVPGFPGCVEHSTMIWDQIQKAKREKIDLHVIWLDLANAYGSVPHQLINYAMEFFHMPTCVKNLVAQYFSNLQMCFSLQDFTTGWQQLEVGIAMGCAISPILFVAAFEIILIGARQMGKTVMKQLSDGLTRIDQSQLPGKLWGCAPRKKAADNRIALTHFICLVLLFNL